MDDENPSDRDLESPDTLQTTRTTFEIIERIKAAGEIGPTQLANELGIAKSTVHRHLATLVDSGYLTEEGGRYSLSLRFLDLGDRARARYGLLKVVKPELDGLVEDIGERAQFIVVENNQAVYIYQTKHRSGIYSGSHIGTHNPLHATAVGKAYLSALPEQQCKEVVGQLTLTKETSQTITDRAKLLEELEKIREQGYATSEEEMKEGIYAIGVPVRDDVSEEVIGGISIAAPETRVLESSFLDEATEKLQSVALVIGLRATY